MDLRPWPGQASLGTLILLVCVRFVASGCPPRSDIGPQVRTVDVVAVPATVAPGVVAAIDVLYVKRTVVRADRGSTTSRGRADADCR